MKLDINQDYSSLDIYTQDHISDEKLSDIKKDIFEALDPINISIDRVDLEETIKRKAKQIMVEMKKEGKETETFLVKTSAGEIFMFTISAITGTTGIFYTLAYSTVNPATAAVLVTMGIACIVVPFVFKSGTSILDRIYNRITNKNVN